MDEIEVNGQVVPAHVAIRWMACDAMRDMGADEKEVQEFEDMIKNRGLED